MERRIAITGRGVTLPFANNTPDNVKVMMDNLYRGVSSVENVAPRLEFLKDYYSQLGSLFPEDYKFNAARIGIHPKEVKRLGPSVQYSFEAGNDAIVQSGFLNGIEDEERERVGVIIGHGLCGIIEVEKQYKRLLKDGISKVNLNLCLKALPDSSPGFMSIHYGLHGPNFSVSTACASSDTAIRLGASSIKSGEIDVGICGGTVESASAMIYASFGQMGANSGTKDDPKKASRPYDRDRDGFVIGEGAGMIVLEEMEHAKARGTTIYGELLGWCGNSDANHVTAPRLDAEYISRAMRGAMRMARVNPEQIAYINAHGTSTPNNDGVETLGIKKAFGERAYQIPISSTKSMIGHTLSSCGVLGVIVALESARLGLAHQTLNLDNPDIDESCHKGQKGWENFLPCDLDYIREGPRKLDSKIVMANAFGFLGHNESLIVMGY
ncbi:MAG: beta-ketoacyl-[acyl-carrier-protein] synthase family protein [Nanoarchaeota archaeon]